MFMERRGIVNFANVCSHSPNIYYFLGGKKFSRELFKYMYENATLYLKRKYDRMKYICNN